MATSKKLKMEDIRAHLFISVIGNHVDIVYHDDADNGAGLGAALLTAIESKEKYSSKTAKKATKSVKKK